MATTNVVVHNKLAQKLSISLKTGSTVEEISLDPRERYNTTSDRITSYTEKLAAKGYIRIRPAA